MHRRRLRPALLFFACGTGARRRRVLCLRSQEQRLVTSHWLLEGTTLFVLSTQHSARSTQHRFYCRCFILHPSSFILALPSPCRQRATASPEHDTKKAFFLLRAEPNSTKKRLGGERRSEENDNDGKRVLHESGRSGATRL
jgi:hypothetical protein